MPDRNAIADEIERLHKAASPAPWVPRPNVDREHVRGAFWSTCKGFPHKAVGQMAGQETAAEREANMDLVCILRSNVPEILAALRSKDREDGAREMRERAALLCDEAAAYFDRTTGHYDRGQAAGSYRATARNTRALPLTTRTEGGNA